MPLRIWGPSQSLPESIPVDAYVDTGASKCIIPKLINDRLFHLTELPPESVKTGNQPRQFPVVSIPKITLIGVTLVGPNQIQLKDTNLEETNVLTWLGDSFIVGMNFLSKFDITMKKEGIITVNR